ADVRASPAFGVERPGEEHGATVVRRLGLARAHQSDQSERQEIATHERMEDEANRATDNAALFRWQSAANSRRHRTRSSREDRRFWRARARRAGRGHGRGNSRAGQGMETLR